MSRLALKQGHFNIILRSTQGCSTRSSSARLAWQDEKLGQSCGNDHPVEKEAATASLQLCVLLLGLLEDGDVGVGVFPEREEILICDACFCRVTHELVTARLTKKGK